MRRSCLVFVGKSQFFSMDQCRHWYLPAAQRGANEHSGGSSLCNALSFFFVRQHALTFPAADAFRPKQKVLCYREGTVIAKARRDVGGISRRPSTTVT
jgi:hypothetical protein